MLVVSATLFVVRVRFWWPCSARRRRSARSVTTRDGCATRRRSCSGSASCSSGSGPGLIHAFIFWGFLVLAPTILIAMIGAVDKHATLPWLGHQGWFAFLADLFATLVLIGVRGRRSGSARSSAPSASRAAISARPT